MVGFEAKPLLDVRTAGEFEAYLAGEPSADGVRVRIKKKDAAEAGMTRLEAVETALCWGWIDGQVKTLDTSFLAVAFTPRRRASMWSKVNQEHAQRLTDEGRMRPAGLAEIERAKADGRWASAYRQAGSETPADLQAAIDGNTAAAAFWPTLGRTQQFKFVFRLGRLKRASTRSTRIDGFVAMLARGEVLP